MKDKTMDAKIRRQIKNQNAYMDVRECCQRIDTSLARRNHYMNKWNAYNYDNTTEQQEAFIKHLESYVDSFLKEINKILCFDDIRHACYVSDLYLDEPKRFIQIVRERLDEIN